MLGGVVWLLYQDNAQIGLMHVKQVIIHAHRGKTKTIFIVSKEQDRQQKTKEETVSKDENKKLDNVILESQIINEV